MQALFIGEEVMVECKDNQLQFWRNIGLREISLESSLLCQEKRNHGFRPGGGVRQF